MPDVTSPNDDIIRRQQEKDLGHPLDHEKDKPGKEGTSKPRKPQEGEGQDRTPNPNRIDENGMDIPG